MVMSIHTAWRLAMFAAAVFVLGSACRADVKLPRIFSDHMVLQQQKPIPVWGTAEAGESGDGDVCRANGEVGCRCGGQMDGSPEAQ